MSAWRPPTPPPHFTTTAVLQQEGCECVHDSVLNNESDMTSTACEWETRDGARLTLHTVKLPRIASLATRIDCTDGDGAAVTLLAHGGPVLQVGLPYTSTLPICALLFPFCLVSTTPFSVHAVLRWLVPHYTDQVLREKSYLLDAAGFGDAKLFVWGGMVGRSRASVGELHAWEGARLC